MNCAGETSYLLVIALTAVACASSVPAPQAPIAVPTRSFGVVRRFEAPEARQGVAVDGGSFYAIDNRRIGKYEKRTGRRLGGWDAGDDPSIIHLNSGVVIDGKLYCAHSNYPSIPMASSIEVFDANELKHLGSRKLPNGYGSVTWLDRFENSWWIAFANYEGRGGEPGKGPADTVLVRFDSAWNPSDRYTFPPQVVARFGTRSNSGGAWGADGLLYATGHDGAEIWALRLPPEGTVLDLAEIVAAGIDGQGIAWDRSEPGTLYGIVKREREVVVLRTASPQMEMDATSGKWSEATRAVADR